MALSCKKKNVSIAPEGEVLAAEHLYLTLVE